MLNAILPKPLCTVENRWFPMVSDNCQDSWNLVVNHVTLAYPIDWTGKARSGRAKWWAQNSSTHVGRWIRFPIILNNDIPTFHIARVLRVTSHGLLNNRGCIVVRGPVNRLGVRLPRGHTYNAHSLFNHLAPCCGKWLNYIYDVSKCCSSPLVKSELAWAGRCEHQLTDHMR